MDFVPLLSAVPLAIIVAVSRRPWPRDIRPRLAAELGLIAAGGIAGALVGGSTGGLVALAGLVPLIVHRALIRRVGRLHRLEQPEGMLRALRWLDLASWPVADQAFNLNMHRSAYESAGDADGMKRFVQLERKRPTLALQLARAETARDRAQMLAVAERMLSAGNQPADHHAALVTMSRIDLARSIDWYSSTEAARLRRESDPVVRLTVLAGAGRVSEADRLAVTLGAGQLETGDGLGDRPARFGYTSGGGVRLTRCSWRPRGCGASAAAVAGDRPSTTRSRT